MTSVRREKEDMFYSKNSRESQKLMEKKQEAQISNIYLNKNK